jgi:hypothetical protein
MIVFVTNQIQIILSNDNDHIVKTDGSYFRNYLCNQKKPGNLKILATIFLTFSIFIQTFSTFIIQADFFLNRSYIAKNLCVNRDKPMMHCNGKCFLTKKLKDQQKQDQSPVSKTERFDVQPFFIPKLFSFKYAVVISKPQYFIKNENAVSSFPKFIFHPPSA